MGEATYNDIYGAAEDNGSDAEVGAAGNDATAAPPPPDCATPDGERAEPSPAPTAGGPASAGGGGSAARRSSLGSLSNPSPLTGRRSSLSSDVREASAPGAKQVDK